MYDESLTAYLWNPITAMVDGEPVEPAPRRGLAQVLRDWVSSPARPWSSVGEEAESAAAADDESQWDEVELRAAAFYFSGLW